MTETRRLFLAALADTQLLLFEPTLVERFEEPSALAEFTVRGLAGHLLRTMTSVEAYLDTPEPDAGPGTGRSVISAAGYYAAVLPPDTDLDSDFHRAIRQRGLETAPARPDELAVRWGESAARLAARLDEEPEDRLVQVYGDLLLPLDEYLRTRLIELVVHSDDLAVSLGVAPPPLDTAATGLAIATLVEVARARRGDVAVLRALTRRERDAVGALRVI
jgi:uncharacterized protein (TIGR03083 family)